MLRLRLRLASNFRLEQQNAPKAQKGRPPAAAVVARLLRCSSPCCAACLCVCSRRRAPCPPLGGVRAPLPAAPLCGAVAGFRGASAAAAASRSVPRGGAAPRAVAPPSFAAPCSPSGCCASLRPRSPSGCAGLLLSCPLRGLWPPLWSLRSLRGVLAPLRPRRAAAVGGVAGSPRGGGAVPPPRPLFPRLSALGGFAASFPLRVARRLSPPCGFGSGRPRRASAPLRRLAAVGRPRGGFWRPLRRPPFVALCAPPRGVWGLRRCGGAFFRGCCCALLCPRCSSALPSAAASFARCRPRYCRAAFLRLRRVLLFKAKIGCKAQPQAQHIVPTIHLIYHIQASSAKLELFCRIICGFRQ